MSRKDPLPTTPDLVAYMGKGRYKHCFGGSGWRAEGPKVIAGQPTLLLTLDLADPKLKLDLPHMPRRLPLASYICLRFPPNPQKYKIEQEGRLVKFGRLPAENHELLEPIDLFPNLFPEKPLRLRPAKAEELTLDEGEQGFCAIDTFVGGEAFIRVGGTPVWLQGPEELYDSARRPMQYVAGLGMESPKNPSGIVEEKDGFKDGFFVGEMGIYFFVSRTLPEVQVLFQST